MVYPPYFAGHAVDTYKGTFEAHTDRGVCEQHWLEEGAAPPDKVPSREPHRKYQLRGQPRWLCRPAGRVGRAAVLILPCFCVPFAGHVCHTPQCRIQSLRLSQLTAARGAKPPFEPCADRLRAAHVSPSAYPGALRSQPCRDECARLPAAACVHGTDGRSRTRLDASRRRYDGGHTRHGAADGDALEGSRPEHKCSQSCKAQPRMHSGVRD